MLFVKGILFMTKYALCWALLASLAAAQATLPSSPNQHPGAETKLTASGSAVAPDTPVITIEGVCDHPSGEKPPANCKKVVTRAQFEMIVKTVQPNLPAQERREFAQRYVAALVADAKMREMGLDRGPKFEQRSKLARGQALAQELSIFVYEEGSKVTDKEVETYYQQNPDLYTEAELTRMLVPGIQQLPRPR